MTKLVTGIEAIASGKRWKHRTSDSWISRNTCIGFNSEAICKQEFVIEPEPREFWVEIVEGKPDYISNTRPPDFSGELIRVREVME
jgi:hypothetical protein